MYSMCVQNICRLAECIGVPCILHLQFAVEVGAVWPHLPLFQACGTRQSRVPGGPGAVVDGTTLPHYAMYAFNLFSNFVLV